MKNIVVTGATSFIGGYLLDELANSSCKIYALVRPNSKNKHNLESRKNVYVIEVGLENIDDLRAHLNNVDVCYHLAWNGTRVPERYDDELQKSNYEYSIETYEVMKDLGCKVFIGVGSQAEYGFCQDVITEDNISEPNTAYGVWKLATGHKLIELGNKDGIRVIWGRIFSIYGKGDYENTLIMSSIRKMQNNEPIDMTEGTQYWNYLYVEDLAKILVELKNNNEASGIYNLASDDTRMLKDYILNLKSALHSDSIINFGAVPYRAEGKVNIMPSIEKLKQCILDIHFAKFNKEVKKLL